MYRPYLVHFMAIENDENISIKASLTLKEIVFFHETPILDVPRYPIQALRLLNAYQFTIRVIGLDSVQRKIYQKNHESDSFGNFSFKIPKTPQTQGITHLQIFEIKKDPGIQYLLGTFIPIKIPSHSSLVISDFDKTLVDTRYSTTKEMYVSLTRPIDYFPRVPHSIKLFKDKVAQGHNPFILSASPHFYEESIRDWLYQNDIYTAGVFLKDYRNALSWGQGELTPKDLKVQGLYKLNHLIDIFLMTGIPREVVLMGDHFESDPLIYLAFASILQDKRDPWDIWRKLQRHQAFRLTKKQSSNLINKLHQLNSMLKKVAQPVKLEIYIRKVEQEKELKPIPDFLNHKKHLIELYDAPPEMKKGRLKS